MSFEVFWDALDATAAAAVQSALNTRFGSGASASPSPSGSRTSSSDSTSTSTSTGAATPRPSFLGPVSFSGLSFGSVPPAIELQSVDVPFDDFYTTTTHGNAQEPRRNGEPSSKTAQPRGDDDIMATVRFHYKGDFQVQVSTELRLNYPSESFMALPVMLCLNNVTCSGTALLAHVGDKLFVSLCEDDGIGSPFHIDLKLESQVGDVNKQAAIKSLSHVLEKFFLEQITRLVRQQLVFPNHVGVSLKALASATAT